MRSLVAISLVSLFLVSGCRNEAAAPPSVEAPKVAAEKAADVAERASTSTDTPPAPPLPEKGAVAVDFLTAGGTWVPLSAGATVPRDSLTLRFRLGEGLTAENTQKSIRNALDGAPAEFRQSHPRVLEVLIAKAPPRMDFWLTGPTFFLYTGTPPRLVSLDPTTGAERIISEAPVDVRDTTLSPDGRRILVETVSATDDFDVEFWLMDTGNGARTRVPIAVGPWFTRSAWRDDRLFLADNQALHVWDATKASSSKVASKGMFWTGLSPDGRYLAGYDYERGKAAIGQPSISNIVVYDLDTGTERVFSGAARALVRSHFVLLRMAWTPDGKALLIQDNVDAKTTAMLRLDLASGKVSPTAEQLPSEPEGFRSPTSWLATGAGWDTVTVTAPDGTRRSFGKGQIIGWAPDGRLLLIRWENWEHTRKLSSI